MTFLTLLTDSPEAGTDSEADSTADDDDSDSELWGNFNFPQLTPEEDTQLAIVLQGGTPQPASIETSTAVVHHEDTEESSRMRSGVLSPPTVQGSSEISEMGSPPPYTMSEFSNNAEAVHHNFLVGSDDTSPIQVSGSSTDRLFYVLVDGVYHIYRRI